jgi:L-ascorbate metabolism protein UlaG (beta-lactamase superfamily)
MGTRIRFFGVAAYELITDKGKHIIVDPFLDENPGSPIKHDQLERVDMILVSHAAWDHLGDTEAIARHYAAPVICGGEVKNYLLARGIPTEQVRATTWSIAVEMDGIVIYPVECHHWSQIKMPDGSYASGVPMSFVIYLDDCRFYHYGDTAIFSDLKLIAELHKPTIGCLGVTEPWEIVPRVPGPGKLITGEMSPYESALAAQWLGLQTVLPCHYCNPAHPEAARDLDLFNGHLRQAKAHGLHTPRSVVLAPGDEIEVGKDV